MYGCDNDRRYSERQIKLVLSRGFTLIEPTKKWQLGTVSRNSFKEQTSRPTRAPGKVHSYHFAGGYCCDTCEKPILYMKGYPDEYNNVKARENIDKENESNMQSQITSLQ